jgi:hypothetical protein
VLLIQDLFLIIFYKKIIIVKGKDRQSGDSSQGWSVKEIIRAEITGSSNNQGEVGKLGEV